MPRCPCVKQFLAAFLALLLVMPAAQAAPQPQQPDAPPSLAQSSQPVPQQDPAIPDSPLPQEAPQRAQEDAPPSSPEPGQNGAPSPVGTAAAPSEEPVGVVASRPAGAAIAPAKQRRARTILISVALVVGAGIAVGTVVALSHASPSQPH
jgi:hypothetical protein